MIILRLNINWRKLKSFLLLLAFSLRFMFLTFKGTWIISFSEKVFHFLPSHEKGKQRNSHLGVFANDVRQFISVHKRLFSNLRIKAESLRTALLTKDHKNLHKKSLSVSLAALIARLYWKCFHVSVFFCFGLARHDRKTEFSKARKKANLHFTFPA